MKERPILFSTDMVRAILDNRKTQTRRVIKPHPPTNATEVFYWWHGDFPKDHCAESGCYYRYPRGLARIPCPYGEPGDRLWVREAFKKNQSIDTSLNYSGVRYLADIQPSAYERGWRPSIHMPRWASRITLEITGIRVERVQDISEEDSIAEGMEVVPIRQATWSNRESFSIYWDRINAKRGYSWKSNPWVWVIVFKRYQEAS